MLKTMRSSFHKLKWTLFVVIIVFLLGFVFFSGSGPGGADDPGNQVVAEVGGERILAADFDRQYRAQLQQYQQMYQGNFTPQLARALDLPRQVLDGMVDRILRLEAARRLNLRVSDEEVAQRIMTLFQDKGQFIGREKYEKMLRANGMYPSRFEQELREDLLAQKYGALVRASVLVPDSDVLREFSNRNEKATIEYILVPASRLESASTPTDAELQAYYDKYRERYRAPEQRRLRYLLVERAKVRTKMTAAEPEIKAEYDRRRDSLGVPEQVNAAHILIKVDADTTDDQARQKAESLAARARVGEDFAKLANENTEDETGKGSGGRLPLFGRGQMVAAFDQAVFNMQPGEIRTVKTEFGHHVIRLDERTPARTRPLEEVRASLEAELLDRKSTAETDRIARELAQKLLKMRAASEDELRKLQSDTITYNTTAWVGKGEAIEGIGANQQLSEEAWSAKVGEISANPIPTARGIAFVRPSEERPAGVPPLAEVRDRVAADWKRERREKDALATLEPAARELAAGGTLGPLAQRYETEVKTTPEFAPGGPIPELGVAPELSEAVFKTPAGQAGPPVPAPGGFVVFRVLTRQQADPSTLETQKGEILETLRSKEAERLVRSYLQQLRADQRVQVNEQLLESWLPEEEGTPRT
ncbi:MAG: SurA N-terminal domain-containing protein [Thermoanaerobaculia bacterium]